MSQEDPTQLGQNFAKRFMETFNDQDYGYINRDLICMDIKDLPKPQKEAVVAVIREELAKAEKDGKNEALDTFNETHKHYEPGGRREEMKAKFRHNLKEKRFMNINSDDQKAALEERKFARMEQRRAKLETSELGGHFSMAVVTPHKDTVFSLAFQYANYGNIIAPIKRFIVDSEFSINDQKDLKNYMLAHFIKTPETQAKLKHDIENVQAQKLAEDYKKDPTKAMTAISEHLEYHTPESKANFVKLIESHIDEKAKPMFRSHLKSVEAPEVTAAVIRNPEPPKQGPKRPPLPKAFEQAK